MQSELASLVATTPRSESIVTNTYWVTIAETMTTNGEGQMQQKNGKLNKRISDKPKQDFARCLKMKKIFLKKG